MRTGHSHMCWLVSSSHFYPLWMGLLSALCCKGASSVYSNLLEKFLEVVLLRHFQTGVGHLLGGSINDFLGLPSLLLNVVKFVSVIIDDLSYNEPTGTEINSSGAHWHIGTTRCEHICFSSPKITHFCGSKNHSFLDPQMRQFCQLTKLSR